MGFLDSDVVDDADDGAKSLNSSIVSCSICLEPVTDNADRSRAMLQCGHEFHLDCIGSAFNIKGAMQCPNCRKTEKGQWLYANNGRSLPDINVEDLTHDEDLYDLGYSEMPFGVQWCPITFSRFPPFEEGEYQSTAYHDVGQHAVFAEHTAVSSSHPCPYVAYYGPFHSSTPNSVGSLSDAFNISSHWAVPSGTGSVSDASNFSSHWGVPSGASEIPTSYAFAGLDPHPHWDHPSPPFSAIGSRVVGSDQPMISSVTQRSRVNSDLPRSGSFPHSFVVGHRAGSSVTSSMIPPYPGSAARARDRLQALQAYYEPPSSSTPMRTPVVYSMRSSVQRGISSGGPMPSSPDQTASFHVFASGTSSHNFQEAENTLTSRFHAWDRDLLNFSSNPVERDSSWGVHHAPNGSTNFRQRHLSEQTPPQNWS